jgi:hypothetical protein
LAEEYFVISHFFEEETRKRRGGMGHLCADSGRAQGVKGVEEEEREEKVGEDGGRGGTCA